MGGLEFDSQHHIQPFQKFYYSDEPNIRFISGSGLKNSTQPATATVTDFGSIGYLHGPDMPGNMLKCAKFISKSGLENSTQPVTATIIGFGSVEYLHGSSLTGLLQSRFGTRAGSRARPKFVALTRSDRSYIKYINRFKLVYKNKFINSY